MLVTRTNNPSTAPNAFAVAGGRETIVASISEQFIVAGDRELAAKIARKAVTKRFAAGETLIHQGGEETDILLILGGSVEIIVNGRVVATRRRGQHVGEVSFLDSYALRSATVRARERTTVSAISEYHFNRIADVHPQLWRRVALSLAERLRERAKFHSPPRVQPAVFIGSSTEGLPIAECLYNSLRRNRVVPLVWSKGVFEAGKTTMEELVRVAGESDFAILVFSSDDVTISRSRRRSSPRDNVLFELGLFVGALTRDRAFVLAPKGVDLKIPTDLLGVTVIPYRSGRGNRLGEALREPLKSLRRQIHKYGPR